MSLLLILSYLQNPPTSTDSYFWKRKPHTYQKTLCSLNLLPQEGQPDCHTHKLSATAQHQTLVRLCYGGCQPPACDSNNRDVTGRTHTDLTSSSLAPARKAPVSLGGRAGLLLLHPGEQYFSSFSAELSFSCSLRLVTCSLKLSFHPACIMTLCWRPVLTDPVARAL